MGDDFENIIQATADLCDRSGARGFEVGYLHDDVPAEEADWYASAQFRGARVIAEHHVGPADAAFALAMKLLTGAKCRCGKLVSLVDGGAVAFAKSSLAHNFGEWSATAAAAAGQCRWRREEAQWVPSCTAPSMTIPGQGR